MTQHYVVVSFTVLYTVWVHTLCMYLWHHAIINLWKLSVFSCIYQTHHWLSVSLYPQYPDYVNIIENPMDLCTIKNKIKCHTYGSLDEFVRDVLLIFANCVKYHKRHSRVGKAGASLKKYFEKRCSDLGLKDLGLIGSIDADNTGESMRRTSTRSKKWTVLGNFLS